MSKHQKLLHRFLRQPNDFSFEELRTLLSGFGYREIKTGRSSGSRVAFANSMSDHIIRLHTPHPTGDLKRYQVRLLIEELRREGVIEP